MINELAAVYSYCENFPAFGIAQPFNVYSCLAFVVAAVLIMGRHRELPDSLAWVIATFLFLIAGASSAWHLTMNPVVLMADLALSALFGTLMIFLIVRYVFYWPLWLCALAIPGVLAVCFFLRASPSSWIMQDSMILMFLSMLLFGAGTWSALVQKSNAGLYLLISSFWMAGGFLILSLDHQACGVFEIGTHFLWHVLAAIVVYCLARTLACADVELLDLYDPARTTPEKLMTKAAFSQATVTEQDLAKNDSNN